MRLRALSFIVAAAAATSSVPFQTARSQSPIAQFDNGLAASGSFTAQFQPDGSLCIIHDPNARPSKDVAKLLDCDKSTSARNDEKKPTVPGQPGTMQPPVRQAASWSL